MFGTEVTYLLGSEASANFWGSSNDHLNAEDLYANITVPVFGPQVAFDIPHRVFSEQKRMAKEGLTKERFAVYTSLIESEAADYIKEWDQEGELDLFHHLATMIVFTATHCLHGKETRDQFTPDTAALYHDLDGGFSPLAWFFPSWVPFPSFLARDRAHRELKKRFIKVIEGRRASGRTDHHDLMNTFLTTKYKKSVEDGRGLNDVEVSGLLIALLMAGQHTSSTTSAWFGFFVCASPGLQQRLYDEQRAAFEKMPGPLTLAHLDLMPLLHACVRETLRLRPPIMTMMRNVREPLRVKVGDKEYVVPKGNQVCVSPTATSRLEEEWEDPYTFKPERFLKRDEDGNTVVTTGEHLERGGKFKWVPFGAGRHRCIGFEFAQIQIRAVWSKLIREFEFELPNGKVPEVNYRTMIHTPLDPRIKYRRR